MSFRKEATGDEQQEEAIRLSYWEMIPPPGPRPPGSRQVVAVGDGGVRLQRAGGPGCQAEADHHFKSQVRSVWLEVSTVHSS